MAHGGARAGAGKPKGKLASHTLQAQELKKALISAYAEHAEDINQALMVKAKTGDVPAIKEVYDRVYGKAINPVELSGPDGERLFGEALQTLPNDKLERIVADTKG